MSYDHQAIDFLIAPRETLDDAENPLTNGMFEVGSQPVIVRNIWATVTTVQASASNILTFKYRPTPGSASGEVTLGTLTITAGAVGRQFYKEITPYKAMPGGQIVVQSDGGGTGSATLGFRGTPSWESPANNPAAVLSA